MKCYCTLLVEIIKIISVRKLTLKIKKLINNNRGSKYKHYVINIIVFIFGFIKLKIYLILMKPQVCYSLCYSLCQNKVFL